MVDVPVWVHDWVHECCGEARRVGDAVDLELTFEGDTVPAAGPDRAEVLEDGRVRIIGTVAGLVGLDEGHTEGTRIASGRIQFAMAAAAPAARVQCTGELCEIRHGYPGGLTSGVLAGLRWRPAIERKLDDVSVAIDGYEAGEELSSTEDRPGDHAGSWAFVLTVRVGP